MKLCDGLHVYHHANGDIVLKRRARDEGGYDRLVDSMVITKSQLAPLVVFLQSLTSPTTGTAHG